MISILIRTDVTQETGAGHFMRCLALAQAWREQGNKVIFALSQDSSVPFPEKIPSDIEIITISAIAGSRDDAKQTVMRAENYHISWIILDGYHFKGTFQKIIRDSGNMLLVIDDYAHSDYYYADLVLNQNVYANPDLYTGRYAGTRLLLGARYTLLRQEFNKWRTWQRDIPEQVKKILVTMGGCDQKNATLTVLHSLRCINDPDIEVRIVTGFHNHFIKQLEKERNNCRFRVSFIDSVSDMAELIAWADMGISGAGSTSWELAFLGLPSLLISLSQNQVPVAQILNEKKVSKNMGIFETLSTDQIQKNIHELMCSQELRELYSHNGRLLVDGFGPDRVIMEMDQYDLHMQPITMNDCMRVYSWTNDPEVRSNSFFSNFIPLEEHKRWFCERLSDPFCVYNLIMNRENNPIGQVRFDINGDNAVISVLIAKESRGKRIGPRAIRLSVESLFRTRPVNIIHAYVKAENTRSLNAFKKTGFRLCEEMYKNNQKAYHLILTR